jgi:hypothetical protein
MASVSAGASSRIAHRVAAADEEGERRGKTKMRAKNSTVAEINSVPAKPVRGSVYQVQAEAKKAAFIAREEMEKPFGIYDPYGFGEVPTALLAVDFLTNFYMSKNDENMNGQLAAGFAAIVKKCAHAASTVLAERDALAALALELERELKAKTIVNKG